MKLRPVLPENTFILNEDSLPTQSDADPYGKVMVFREDVGWTVVQLPRSYTVCGNETYTLDFHTRNTMTKKEFSYIVFSNSGENVEEIHGVYKDLEGATYGARSALSTLFPKHGDQVKIIRCEIISTEEAKKQHEDARPKDLFEKADCEDGYCPLPTQQVS